MICRLKQKSIAIIFKMLKEGMSLHKIALCIALGITLGIFPVLGMTTLLCTIAAITFRLNLPAIQLVNYMVYPAQLVLIAPFYSAGGWFIDRQVWLKPDESIMSLMKNDFWGSMTSLWDLSLYAIFTWMVICPFLILILYVLLKPAIAYVSSIHKPRLP